MTYEEQRQILMMAMAQYISEMSAYERNTYMSNYDRFKQWLCQGLGIAKSAVQSAWDWFKGLFD